MLKGDKAKEGKGKVGNRLQMKGPTWPTQARGKEASEFA